ncbi:bifunctional oligoribonuclease/PAP phosphatase NrnA [Candidatus Parcubacteria bacterium]|jgi:bifunctional oligoribonuclease and PAP phosphatase NrnA|nr:bifunctional oligoribonuclease/PAP phosphatase NrnA [Candidatus Parcubacteria bacterium]
MQNHKLTSQAIYQQIDRAHKILLISHRNPDGDTLGSNFAMFNFLKNQGKEVTSFCVDPVPNYLNFLPDSHNLSNDHRVFTKTYDTVITLDCSTIELTAAEYLLQAIPSKYTFINIDHHVSNPGYGDISLVSPQTSSTAELLHNLFMDWKIEWNENIATNLACGVITDTGGLKNPATSYQSLSATSDLVNKGANIHKIMNVTLNQTSINKLKLWGRALERLTKVEKYNLVYTFITIKDFEECQADEDASEGMSNFLHVLKEGEVILVLREVGNNTIKGSLRTTGKIDLTKIAGLFGGGGHRKAAGFSLSGKLDYDNNKLRII